MPKKKLSKYYYIFRSAITGRWVKKDYADMFPKVCIRIRRLRKGLENA